MKEVLMAGLTLIGPGTRESPKTFWCYGIGAHQFVDVHGRKL
jgi:hypothetical protein